MTPSEQWILGLFAVYSIPAFILGVGVTLVSVRWRNRKNPTRVMPSFLSPERTFEPRDLDALGATPPNKVHTWVAEGLKLH